MQRTTTTILILLVAVALMFVVSCKENPVKSDPPYEEPDINWPDITERDDVIEVVVLCYEYPKDAESSAKYNALLHSQYFFGLAAGDVPPGESPIMTRAEDIASTELLFTEQTMMELVITETGSWYEYAEIEGETCENCYVTERQYFIRVQLGEETTIYQSPVGRAFVSIIVSPDENDSSKWVLRAMYDLGI